MVRRPDRRKHTTRIVAATATQLAGFPKCRDRRLPAERRRPEEDITGGADGCRWVLYHGVERNDPWCSVRVAAVNMRRPLVLGLTVGTRPGVLA
jgi:hypothetical protein